MSSEYIFSFTDPNKGTFAVFPYTADGPRSPHDSLLIDHAIRASTTLKFVGRGLPDYGQWIEQNTIYLLENFAGPTAPVYPIEGQLWYKNNSGELNVRNGSGAWVPALLTTGSSHMTGPLVLSTAGDPGDGSGSQNYYAVPKGYVDGIKTDVYAHINNGSLHLTSYQHTLLTGVESSGVTSGQVATLLGINTATTVQAQLNTKLSNVSSSFNTLGYGVNITLNGGNIYGLPSTAPSDPTVAVSKAYVDTLVASGAVGDGRLTSSAWLSGTGSPVADPSYTTLDLIVTLPNTSTSHVQVQGISRVGHTHAASDITVNTTSLPSYPGTTQQAIEYIDLHKANVNNPSFTGTATFGGNVIMTGTNTVTGTLTLNNNPSGNYEAATKLYVDTMVSASNTNGIPRTLQVVGSPATIIQVPSYFAASNTLFVYVNGIKQYGHIYGGQQKVNYALAFSNITSTAPTYLDPLVNYHFNVTVDGVGPTLITVPAASSPTHGTLASTINSALQSAGLKATFSVVDTTTEIFKSSNSGASAAIVISDPGIGSPPNNYLFGMPTPNAVVAPQFVGVFTDPNPANWTIPDTITVSGNQTAIFTAGTNFTILGSTTSSGSYDGVYSVYTTGPTYNGGTNQTTIPIAQPGTPAHPIPLISSYSTAGSPLPPAPTVTTAGSVYRTPLGGFTGLGTPGTGIDGDYREVTATGSPATYIQATPGSSATAIQFNYTVPAGARIEASVI